MLVDSTMIKSIEYHRRVLVVTFQNDSKYSYHKVPRAVYDKLVVAPSKGQYFNRNIKWQFGYKKLN